MQPDQLMDAIRFSLDQDNRQRQLNFDMRVKRGIQRGAPIAQSRDGLFGGNGSKGQFAAVDEVGVPLVKAAGRRQLDTFNGRIDKSAGVASDGRSFCQQRPAFQRLPDRQSLLFQERREAPFPDLSENCRIKSEPELSKFAQYVG